MAETKQFLLGLVVVLMFIFFTTTLYTSAISNGGYTSSPNNPLEAQTTSLNNRLTAFQGNLTSSTSSAAQSNPTASDVNSLSVFSQAVSQTLLLLFDALGLAIGIATYTLTSPVFGFIPGWFIGLTIIFITLSVVIAMLAAFSRWNI